MALRRRRDKMKEWLSGLFSSKHEVHTPNGPFYHGVAITNIQSISADSAIHVHGDNNTVTRLDGQGDRTIDIRIIDLLLQHIIHGAAHDDSARDPPPRCHPDTRVKLIARITTWFEGKDQEKLLLWITGPAGVGKSAIVQTFAEYLAESRYLGASVFISRPNKRNKAQGVFITIAYQLATRIMEYRYFIVERLTLDPSLLNKGLAAQFKTFIIEPFVEKKIGAGGKRWGILLDGLDELQGEDAQCEIIRLINNFAHEHRDTPLIWIIASRPESHISNTFDDDDVRGSCQKEYIPIDSTESCADVERFLRSSFKAVQKKYRHSVHSGWPSNTDFLKLTAAASGLFIYAQVVMRFIGDPNHGDPTSRFLVLLSVIDRSNAVQTEDNPFVHLDALYNEILCSIPSTLWPTAKRILALTIYVDEIFCAPYWLSPGKNVDKLRGIGLVFGIPRHVIYACLSKCRSILEIPDWKLAHQRKLAFLHASFADYLKDSSRSGEFNVGNLEDVLAAVTSSYLEIWIKCSEDDTAAVTVESAWYQYCSRLDDRSPSREIAKFHANMFRDMVDFVDQMVYHNRRGHQTLSTTAMFLGHSELHNVNMIKLSYYFNVPQFIRFVEASVKNSTSQNGRVALLQNLKLDHLDCEAMSPAYVYDRVSGSEALGPTLRRPRSRAQLKAFVSELESFRGHSPQFEVVIFGGIPKWRVAAFRRTLKKESDAEGEEYMHYIIPYPE